MSNLTKRVRLQIAGIHLPAARAREALWLLSKLRARLEALRDLLPNLSATLDCLASVAALNLRQPKPAPPDFDKFTFGARSGAANFVEWLLAHYPLTAENPLVPSAALLDVLAIRWVHSAALRAFGDQLPFDPFHRMDTPTEDLRKIQRAESKMKTAGALGALTGGYEAWLSNLRSHAPECQLPAMVESLGTIRETDFQIASPKSIRPPPHLDERQLGKGHWHFPSPLELSKLHKCLARELAVRGESTKQNEAGLIALAIFASRPVQNMLSWPMCTRRTTLLGIDRIGFVPVRSRTWNKTYWASAWLKAEHGKGAALAQIVLPWGIQNWLSSIFPGMGTLTVLEMLPYSEVPWDLRAYRWLADELECNLQRAQLIVRDLIPRLIYDETSNSALVHFWRADNLSQIDRADRVALSHYLQAYGKRVEQSFAKACELALGEYNNSAFNRVSVPIGSSPLNLDEASQILKELNKSVESQKDPIAHHNALASLTLFVCLLTTGHRRSTSPFPFPWDFDLSQDLVFICDKLVTGSEARFVPLTPTTVSCLTKYIRHLQKVARSSGFPKSTRTYAAQLHAFLHPESQPPTFTKRVEFTPAHGVFFWLTDSGDISEKGLTTNRLDALIEGIAGIPQVTRRLRSTIANYLWNEGCSGREIQAFLGHQPELHAHGPSSTWSVLDVTERLSPIIESYFTKALKRKVATPIICFPSGNIPSSSVAESSPDAGNAAPGYEGRARESAWAMHRARSAIRQELSEYLLAPVDENGDTPTISESSLANPATSITAEDVAHLQSRIRDELASDPKALRKVTSVLEAQIERLRRSQGLKISMGSSAYRLSAPGPVEVGFSRLLRCGLVLRHVWERNVGIQLGEGEEDEFAPLERLAHLTISLVCFDGVLAQENIEGLVMSATRGGHETYDGLLTLRCNVVTPTHDYDFSVRPGPVTSALILGITSNESEHQYAWLDIQARVVKILSKLMKLGAGSRWSVLQLCLVMRPYWLLRLPGAMYSVATGEFKGPAADNWSEAQLHGMRVPPTPMATDEGRSDRVPLMEKQSRALKGLLTLFRKSVGEREKGERRRLVQRAKLKMNLQSDSAKELSQWSSETQIVTLLLTFIERLVSAGGPRVKTLALTSMEKYFSSIAYPLISEAWEFDFEEAQPQDLRRLFDAVSKSVKSDHGHAVLKLFSAHLRDELSVPYISAEWFSPRVPIRIRSSLLLPNCVTRSIKLLRSQQGQEYHQAANLISIGFGYGLRKLEIFGLSASQFDATAEGHLSVSRTRIADLKTRSGRRVLAKPLSSDATDAATKAAVALARTSQRSSQFLFESSSREFQIARIGPISAAATRAIRAASDLPTAVPYHLRHSFATILGLALFAPEKGSGRLLEKLAIRYVDPSYALRIREIVQMPKNWPFGVDAVARVLGHADSGTFLNVYFHGSHLVIADRCERWQPANIQQIRLGHMLGRDRTVISKLGSKLKDTGKNEAPSIKEIVRHLAQRDNDGTGSVTTAAESGALVVSQPNRWPLVFRALQYRMANELSIEEMKAYAIECLGLSVDFSNQFVKNYAELVLETGLDDFEPVTSSLLKPRPSHRQGVVRGSIEREHFASQVQAWTEMRAENADLLYRLLISWGKRVDSARPLVVCRSTEEFSMFHKLLVSVGATDEQLRITLHGDDNSLWLADIARERASAKYSTRRASRGIARSNVAEVSIAVDQFRNSPVPDGRDLHRALIGLFAATNTQFIW